MVGKRTRKDWVGRVPRWRLSLTQARCRRLIEALSFFIVQKSLQTDPRYMRDFELLRGLSKRLDEPLLDINPSRMPLFEELNNDSFGSRDNNKQ